MEQVIEFEPGLDSFSDKLIEVKSAQARVFLMYARYVCFFTNYESIRIQKR